MVFLMGFHIFLFLKKQTKVNKLKNGQKVLNMLPGFGLVLVFGICFSFLCFNFHIFVKTSEIFPRLYSSSFNTKPNTWPKVCQKVFFSLLCHVFNLT